MLNLSKDETLIKPIFIKEPFPLLICDDFITKEECNLLIKDGKNASLKSIHKVMGGRFIIPWHSNVFSQLCKDSLIWRKFSKSMPKKVFDIFSEVSDKLIDKNSFYKKYINNKNFYFVEGLYTLSKKFLSKNLYLSYKKGLDIPVRTMPFYALIFYGLFGFIDSNFRRLKSLLDFFVGRIPLVPLFDYSISYEGYTREIHRDTDSRVFVCLLYLNELEGAEDKDLGGSLEIFEQINNNKYFVPQPDSSQVRKIANIEPKAGRLVVFFNQSNSYHAVSKMQYQKKGRHIVYGGFSLQSSIGSAARFRSKGKLPTNYLIYR